MNKYKELKKEISEIFDTFVEYRGEEVHLDRITDVRLMQKSLADFITQNFTPKDECRERCEVEKHLKGFRKWFKKWQLEADRS